jgi:hypothetical protein
MSLWFFPSCSDWLDLKPYDGVVENDFWKTKEDVYSVLIGCYSSLLDKTLVSNIIYWGEARAELLTGSTAASSTVLNIIRGEISPENTIVKWDQFYTTINHCNKVIEKSAIVKDRDLTFSDALYRQYKAEATTIRSLMYFYLVRSFSDVPLVLEASDNDQQDYYLPKTEGHAILDTLARHLNEVKDALPATFGSSEIDKGRITKWVALSLLADIYLWQGNYAKCDEYTTQIIGSGYFTLIPVSRSEVTVYDTNGDSIDLAYYANAAEADNLFHQLYVAGNSVESIFELQFPKTHETLADPFFGIFNSSSNRPQMIPKSEILDEFIFPRYEWNSNVKDIRGDNFSYKSSNGYVWKYTGTSRSGNTLRTERNFPHWIIYRLSDIILMKAEALNQMAIRNGDDQRLLQQSYELVQQIRVRANAVGNPEIANEGVINGKALENLILEERAREFAFEGKRWYDVLRFARRDNYAGSNRNYLSQLAIRSAPPEKVQSLQVKYNNNWFHYWPIYVNTVEINKNLKQNEFYSQN